MLRACSNQRLLAAFFFVVAATLSSSPAAVAQETPILVAKGLPLVRGWCGDHAIHYVDESDRVVWLDVHTRKQIKFPNLRKKVWVQTCSPSGRWVIVMASDDSGKEGGDPGCDPPEKTILPVIALWDTRDERYDLVGQGAADFRWSPDGKLLLHRFTPFCELERDPRNAFKLPPSVQEFKTISVRSMTGSVLGWRDKARIGAMSWFAPDAFVVQLPEDEGNPLNDATPGGAIVAFYLNNGTLTRLAQLNPKSFKSSWTLGIPQLWEPESEQILLSAHCSTGDYALGPIAAAMVCEEQADVNVERKSFRPDLDRYCATLTTGDVAEFCKPADPTFPWQQQQWGAAVLVLKPVRLKSESAFDLFRIDGHLGGYLK